MMKPGAVKEGEGLASTLGRVQSEGGTRWIFEGERGERTKEFERKSDRAANEKI